VRSSFPSHTLRLCTLALAFCFDLALLAPAQIADEEKSIELKLPSVRCKIAPAKDAVRWGGTPTALSAPTTSGDRSTPTSLGPRQPRAEAGKQARKSQIQDLVRRGDIKNSQTAHPLILASARHVGGAALPSWFGFAPLAPRETPKIAPRKLSPAITEACSPGKASPEGLAGTEAGDRSGTTSTSLASKQNELPKVELRFLKPRPRPTARSLVLADGKSRGSAGSIGNSESNERWLGQTGDGTIGFTLWFLTLQSSRPTPLDPVQLAAGRHSVKPALVKLTAPDVAVESSFAKASTFANLSSVAFHLR